MKTKGVLTAFALSFVLAVPFASAAEQPACKLEKELADLGALKVNPAQDSASSVKAELAIRKEILRKIVDCSVAEAKNIQSSLRSISPDDEEVKDIQRQFGREFDGTVEYYTTQKAKINDLGIRGSQNLSRNLKEWRASNYSRLAERTVNFIIWMKNQTLFRNAENRLHQVNQAIKTLKLIDNDEVRAAYEEAEASLNDAKRLNEATKHTFKLFDPERQSLTMVKQSLGALSLTYEKFFDVSKAVNKIIPQAK